MEQQVATLRSFNRTVTERIGALQDDYLSRGRPLGASRVLWEIPPSGTDTRSLRTRLGLDSGYLSRLLRSLEGEHLVEVEPSDGDGRVRRITLTRKGTAEQSELDRLSNLLAESLLSPLNPRQREELIHAVASLDRLLTAGLVDVRIEHPASQAAQLCINAYYEELDARFEGGFEPALSISADVDELTPPAGILLLARLRGEPVGCGAVKLHGSQPAELKRMWVAKSARGLGLGRRLLNELENHASRKGATVVRLETNRALTEAISLYRSSGYVEVAPFNKERFADHWFEKELTPK